MGQETLPRTERLRGKKRFDELFSQGRLSKRRLVLVRALKNGLPLTRAASIVARVAGNAVARNRIRRRLRAAFRELKKDLPHGWDLVILARRGVLNAPYTLLKKQLQAAIQDLETTEPSSKQEKT